MRALLFAAMMLSGCSPPCDCSQTVDAGHRAQASLPPLEPDGTYTEPPKPCDRVSTVVLEAGTWIVPIPCRPYDRVKDLPDPQP